MSDRSYINVSEGTTACDSLALCGCSPASFLGATATATNTNCLGGVLAANHIFGCSGVGYLNWASCDANAITKAGFYTLITTTNAPFAGDGGLINIPAWAGNNGTCRYNLQIASALADCMYYRITNDSGVGTWKTFITSSNIGSQSVATANNSTCLNGQLGSYYQPASTAINTGNIASQSVTYAATAGGATNSACLEGSCKCCFVYGSNGSGSNTANAGIYCPYELAQYKSGFWEVTGSAWTPTTDWYWGLTAAHTSNNSAYNYSMQLVGKYGGSGCDFYTRTVDNGVPNAWRKLATQNSSTLQLDIPSNSGNGGIISTGNYAGTGSAAFMPSGLYTVGPNWLYGTTTTNGAFCHNTSCYCIGATGAAAFATSVTTPTICASGALTICGGSTNTINLVTNGAYVLRGINSSCTSLYFNGCEKLKTVNAGVNVIGILSGSSYMCATDFKLGSDCRLKTNIEPIEISAVNIEYKQFELISEPNHLRYGVIAQELQLENPELVSVGDNGMLGVSYIDLLVKEVAYLKCRVSELEKRII